MLALYQSVSRPGQDIIQFPDHKTYWSWLMIVDVVAIFHKIITIHLKIVTNSHKTMAVSGTETIKMYSKGWYC